MPALPMNQLNVTFLIPYAGNRFLPSASKDGTIHIMKTEAAKGTLAQCGVTVVSGAHSYNHRLRLRADEVSKVCSRCLGAVAP